MSQVQQSLRLPLHSIRTTILVVGVSVGGEGSGECVCEPLLCVCVVGGDLEQIKKANYNVILGLG